MKHYEKREQRHLQIISENPTSTRRRILSLPVKKKVLYSIQCQYKGQRLVRVLRLSGHLRRRKESGAQCWETRLIRCVADLNSSYQATQRKKGEKYHQRPTKCLAVGARARLIRALQPACMHGSSLSPSPPPPPVHYYNKGDPIKHVSRRFTHTQTHAHSLTRARTRTHARAHILTV